MQSKSIEKDYVFPKHGESLGEYQPGLEFKNDNDEWVESGLICGCVSTSLRGRYRKKFKKEPLKKKIITTGLIYQKVELHQTTNIVHVFVDDYVEDADEFFYKGNAERYFKDVQVLKGFTVVAWSVVEAIVEL